MKYTKVKSKEAIDEWATRNCIEIFDHWDQWVTVLIHTMNGSYSVDAKIYNEGSKFGICNGRVSKIRILNYPDGSLAYNYDRGLDVDRIEKDDLFEILRVLEDAPYLYDSF